MAFVLLSIELGVQELSFSLLFLSDKNLSIIIYADCVHLAVLDNYQPIPLTSISYSIVMNIRSVLAG